MAHPGELSGLADLVLAIVAALWRTGPARPRLVTAIRDQVRPIPGVELMVPGGALLTGIVVVTDNRPVLMIVARHEPPPRRWTQPEPLSPAGPPALRVWDDEHQ